MQVNSENAQVVHAILFALTDPRFTMRGLSAIKKASGNPELTSAQIMNAAAEMGCPQRRRVADDKILIQRPVTIEEVKRYADMAAALIAGTQEPFEVDFTPEIAPPPVEDGALDHGGDGLTTGE